MIEKKESVAVVRTPPKIAAVSEPARVFVFVSTIPSRRHSCERVLAEVARQTRKPDGVILVLDGYGEASPPSCSLPFAIASRTAEPLGPGNRWRVVRDYLHRCTEGDVEVRELGSYPLRADDVIINLDDDVMLCEAPRMIAVLTEAVESGLGAAAVMGRTTDGMQAAPGMYARGDLIHGAGCGLAVRARHLVGIEKFAIEVLEAGGPDALGIYGDDDALVSAYLWKIGVRIVHVAAGNVFEAAGMQDTSQTQARARRGEDLEAQKRGIAKVTGWPWIVI